jgi:hypothetical protein
MNNVYILKQQSKALSITVNSHAASRNYVIGFQSVHMARKVHYSLSPDIEPSLVRVNNFEVTDEVNQGLSSLNKPIVKGKIYIDTHALLHIPKKDQNLSEELGDMNLHLQSVDYLDFMMYPFEQNIGIIMPYRIEKENQYEIQFLSNVVDALDTYDTLRSSFDKLFKSS